MTHHRSKQIPEYKGQKLDRMPSCLNTPRFKETSLEVDGASVVKVCIQTRSHTGSMFMQEHLLLAVLKGTNTIRYGKDTYMVHAGEVILMRKNTVVDFHKEGDPEQEDGYECLFFFLKDEFLNEFARTENIGTSCLPHPSAIMKASAHPRLRAFFESVKIYFHKPEIKVADNLLKLKMLELLYDIAATDSVLLSQVMNLSVPVQTSIPAIMEANCLRPMSLSEFAELSGRSLSSFRRDFQKVYNQTPAAWIREKRLMKAHELIAATSLSITEICYMVGFENPAHFSRLYKNRFGYSPSQNAEV